MRNLIKSAVTFYRTKRDWFGDGGIPAAPELAQKRADICKTCPYNKESRVWELFAGAAAFAVKQQLKLKSELSLRVNGEEDLHVCSACLCILGLKVHTPLKYILESSETGAMHPDCWIYLEQKEQQNLQHNDNKSSDLPKQ